MTPAATVTIRTLTVAEFAARPELPALLAEYSAESAVAELRDSPGPQWPTYAALEAQGMLHAFGAFDGPVMVGFVSVAVTVLPHFGALVASTESFFVAAAARRTGAGLALLRRAEQVTRDTGAVGLLVSAPVGSRLARVLAATDMRQSHEVYFKPAARDLQKLEGTGQLPALAPGDLAKVQRLQAVTQELPQLDIPTQHMLHAGMYARTILIPAGAVIVGAHILLATILVLDGDATVFVGGEEGDRRYTGRHVIAGAAGRKQVFLAHADTHLTMIFPTRATTVAEAEAEFTDEADELMSRKPGATNLLTLEHRT